MIAIVIAVPLLVFPLLVWIASRLDKRRQLRTRLQMRRELGASLSDRLPAKKRQRIEVVR